MMVWLNWWSEELRNRGCRRLGGANASEKARTRGENGLLSNWSGAQDTDGQSEIGIQDGRRH
jgi:hypothetical protein